MNVIETANNGVVNEQTIFVFRQDGPDVSASYNGGEIIAGFLVGTLENDEFQFTYCQKQLNGKLDNGSSTCKVSKDKEGRLKLIEYFEWASRPGEMGMNVFAEIK